MAETCSGESFDFSRLLGRGRMARSGYSGEAVSGERVMDSEEEREKPGGLAYSVRIARECQSRPRRRFGRGICRDAGSHTGGRGHVSLQSPTRDLPCPHSNRHTHSTSSTRRGIIWSTQRRRQASQAKPKISEGHCAINQLIRSFPSKHPLTAISRSGSNVRVLTQFVCSVKSDVEGVCREGVL